MRPRRILPGQFYMLSRRITQRLFLLRPDPETNAIFLYCLAEAAKRFGIVVILPIAMSHVVFFDPQGHAVQFTEHFHKMVARALNAHRGRWENLWSSEPPSLVRLVDPADVLEKLVYVATNPVKDHLVERAHQWPGVTGLSDLLNRRTIMVRRPRHFFRAGGSMPAVVTLELTIPSELGDPEALLAELRRRVASFEARCVTERQGTGRRVLGRRGVLRQDWRHGPSTPAPRRGLRPRIAARNRWARAEALLRDRAFEAAYRDARRLWLAGRPALFPPGTYWLRRFANVPIATVA